MYQFVEIYEKNPRLTNFQISEIRNIVPKDTKCADSWRNNRTIQVGDSRHPPSKASSPLPPL